MMGDEVLGGIPSLFKAACNPEKTGKKWAVFLEPAVLRNAAQRMKDDGYHLEDITGLDTKDGLLAVYHFDHYTCPGRIALYVIIPHTDPKLPSISSIYSGAGWHERECHDFYGIQFTDHPHLDPLLMPDDLKIHPLLKDDDAHIPLKEFFVPEAIIEKETNFTLLDGTDAPDEATPASNDTEGST
ncbi:MAG: NADH-quinone oxidoreductase subunit C [Deltaproteobacteria bacterium]|nr:NADH-quinone oxidoreductase subunit C [Deltaproteobacteria bacterium]